MADDTSNATESTGGGILLPTAAGAVGAYGGLVAGSLVESKKKLGEELGTANIVIAP